MKAKPENVADIAARVMATNPTARSARKKLSAVWVRRAAQYPIAPTIRK